jgi:CHAT domain-containing protein/tetratricopeptide (TPR) repeat protein
VYDSVHLSPLQRFLVRPSIRGLCAIPGSALVAFSLSGSAWRSPIIDKPQSPAVGVLHAEGLRLYKAGEYVRANLEFRSAALRAQSDGSLDQAAMNWSNAGAASLAHLEFGDALSDFLAARRIAESPGLRKPFLFAMNNLASLYLQMGDPSAAMRVAGEGLSRSIATDDIGACSRLRFQLATALGRLHRFDEAAPIYRRAIDEIFEQGDLEATARVLGDFGSDCLEAGRLEDAEAALSDALLMVRLHRLDRASANILRALAKLKGRQGDARTAAAMFEAALEAPQTITPRWQIYADRGEFRLARNDLRGALADFREARKAAAPVRADSVPADPDRIALEGGLSRVAAGLADAGNRLARQTADDGLVKETFDTAEQDRLWSLRALVPTPNDWRTRLPNKYWDLLARYQINERALVANPSPAGSKQSVALQAELREIEASVSGQSQSPSTRPASESAWAHTRAVLDADSVLLSFHISTSGGWLWALDRRDTGVYPIPGREVLRVAAASFAHATRFGEANAGAQGRTLYKLLFGSVPSRYLSHKRWLLELDDPLFDVPFAALVIDIRRNGKNEPVYLVEQKVLQSVPGALMLEPRTNFGNGPFLGIGDPIYSPADPRYRGDRTRHDVVLPRLPATAGEIEACSRAWNPASMQLLMGANAGLASVRTALRSNPSVIHFATHVITAPGDYSSGLIALSLDRNGAMGLMGPAEIAAYAIKPSLVVLNGCHSGQGEALPGGGLMGLTRAWIGSGARSVLATRWDIPDEAGSRVMVEFYRALRKSPDRGPAFALQQAQSGLLRSRVPGNSPAVWGAYFVLGRE